MIVRGGWGVEGGGKLWDQESITNKPSLHPTSVHLVQSPHLLKKRQSPPITPHACHKIPPICHVCHMITPICHVCHMITRMSHDHTHYAMYVTSLHTPHTNVSHMTITSLAAHTLHSHTPTCHTQLPLSSCEVGQGQLGEYSKT